MSKKEVLEEAAIELTYRLSLTMYPDDIEKYYEDGMTSKELILKVLVIHNQNNKKSHT